MKTFELKKKEGAESSIYAIALVENPAIQIGFVALSENSSINLVKLSESKMMLYTPLVIPNQKILRVDETTGEEYQIFFSEETCEEILHDFMQAKLNSEFNSEHTEDKINDVHVVESWIIDNPEKDRATELGFKGLPKGTPMVGISLKNNPKAFKACKEGTYKGISIEGIFDNYTTNLNNHSEMKILDSINAKLSELLDANKPETKLASLPLEGGEMSIHFDGELAEGTAIYVNSEMTEAAPDGEHRLEDGRVITVSEGALVSVVEMEAELTEEVKETIQKAEKAIDKVSSENEELSTENETLKTEKAELTAKLSEKENKVKELEAKLKETPAKGSVKLNSQPAQPNRIDNFLNTINLIK